MINIAYMFVLLFCSIMIETLCDKSGTIIPIVALVILYLSVAYDWKIGAILGLLSGFIIDLLFARDIFVSPFALLIVSLIGLFWLYRGDVKDVKLQILPGTIVAFIYSFFLLSVNYFLYEDGAYLFFLLIIKIFITICLGGFLFPCIVKLLDMISSKLKINLYVTAQKRLLEND